MKKVKNNLFFILIAFCSACGHQELNKENEKEDVVLSRDSCVTLNMNESQAEKMLQPIFAYNYDSILKKLRSVNSEMIYQNVKSTLDPNKIDSIITIKLKSGFLKFYSKAGTKILMYAHLTDNSVSVIKDIAIGIEYNDFHNIVMESGPLDTSQKYMKCVHITNQSEYDHLYFVFKEQKLALIEYDSNIETY